MIPNLAHRPPGTGAKNHQQTHENGVPMAIAGVGGLRSFRIYDLKCTGNQEKHFEYNQS